MMYVRCSRCGTRRPSGTKCDCIKKRHKIYDKYYRDDKSKKFYESSDWQRVRKCVLEQYDGIDVYHYYITGEIIKADVVHHIEPLRDSYDKGLDMDNLIPLSSSTHNHVHHVYNSSDVDKKNMKKDLLNALSKFNVIYK